MLFIKDIGRLNCGIEVIQINKLVKKQTNSVSTLENYTNLLLTFRIFSLYQYIQRNLLTIKQCLLMAVRCPIRHLLLYQFPMEVPLFDLVKPQGWLRPNFGLRTLVTKYQILQITLRSIYRFSQYLIKLLLTMYDS